MLPLTPEQREYKEVTLNQLLVNQEKLGAGLEKETRPRVVKTIQKQLADIDAHVSRLRDELSGNMVIDEPVAEGLLKKSAMALDKGKFYLAKRHITKLETIEPFYPGLARLKTEVESRQVSRRTRSIAQGTATGYPDSPAYLPSAPQPQVAGATAGSEAGQPAGNYYQPVGEEPEGWFSKVFQFHIVLSCLVVMLLLCVVFGMAGFTILQWLVEGGV